jgi:hypothetical protein
MSIHQTNADVLNITLEEDRKVKSFRFLQSGGLTTLALALLLGGCDGQTPPATVADIDPNSEARYNVNTIPDGGYEGDYPSSIEVTFSKSLTASSVNTESFAVTMEVQSGPGVYRRPIEGEVAYNGETSSATFTPSAGHFAEVVNSAGIIQGNFTVRLLGTGSNVIVDEDDLALDGDNDGTPGGDFQSTFVVALGPY